jgi:hypothetical protein
MRLGAPHGGAVISYRQPDGGAARIVSARPGKNGRKPDGKFGSAYREV